MKTTLKLIFKNYKEDAFNQCAFEKYHLSFNEVIPDYLNTTIEGIEL